MSNTTITVTQLVHYLKRRLESDTNLQGVLVEGEISNFSPYRSGHWYFSIKDAGAQMKCVMFASMNARLNFRPKDGDKVIVRGNISVYEGRGEMQMTVTGMKPSGIGDLYLQYEALKKKLFEEGLFADAHKKPLPKYPMQIALVTGKNTAARADVLTTLKRRWPIAEITEYPVLVQGNESAGQIISALLTADQKNYDVILLVRGGGSIEDLWSFNDEALAHVIYNLQTPLVTGVGHEVDFTIADYVADMRAPTPTGAAERCSPNYLDVAASIAQAQLRMQRRMKQRIDEARNDLEHLSASTVFRMPERLYQDKLMNLEALSKSLDEQISSIDQGQNQRLDQYKQTLTQTMHTIIRNESIRLNANQMHLQHAMETDLQKQKQTLLNQIQLLNAYSPLKILERGYGLIQKDNTVMHSISQLHPRDTFEVKLSDGLIHATVNEIEEKTDGKERKDI